MEQHKRVEVHDVESVHGASDTTIADLNTLPRIGETMAQRIRDYREAYGRFTSIEDLGSGTGIGDKTFAAL